MKKIALLASAVAVSAAVADAPACCSMAGFYTGLNFGWTGTQTKETGKQQADTSYDSKKSDQGYQYGVFGGYNMGLGNNFVAGMELFLAGDSSKISHKFSNNGVNTDSELKRTTSYGVAPRVGYMITPNVLGYVRLGLEGGSWKFNYKTSDNNPNISNKKNTVSFAPGLGFDMLVSKNVFVRAQYHYLFGPKFRSKNSNDTTNVENKISQQVFTLAVGYKF